MAFKATGSGVERIQATMLVKPPVQNWTLMCWVYIDTTSEKGSFFYTGGDQNVEGGGYGLSVGDTNGSNNGNDTQGDLAGVAWQDANNSMGTGWHHICYVDRGGQQFIYLDGNLSAGFDSAAITSTNNSFALIGHHIASGGDDGNSLSADNRVAFCKEWNQALGTAQIQTEMRSEFPVFYNGLTLFWPANRSDGGRTTDINDPTQRFTPTGVVTGAEPAWNDNPPIARC